VVNERRFASNVAEAIPLSPTIHQLIQTDIAMHEFVRQVELITSDAFYSLLNSVRGFQVDLIQSHKSSFRTISHKLCNSRLEVFFVSIFGTSCNPQRFSIDSSRGFDVNVQRLLHAVIFIRMMNLEVLVSNSDMKFFQVTHFIFGVKLHFSHHLIQFHTERRGRASSSR
jgi:hypothetical protein